MRRTLLTFALTTTALGCHPSRPPHHSLGALISRVDVPRLLLCRKHLPDYKAAAKCLGAEAATQGLQMALDKAVKLTDRALEASGPTGADDMTDAERSDLAGELDEAMLKLAAEIDATHVLE